MMSRRAITTWIACHGIPFFAEWCGCRHAPPPAAPASRAAVENFCQFLIRNEWTEAYSLLDAESRN